MTPAMHLAAPAGNVPHIGFGHVWHTRLRPRRHRFIVPTFFLLLPMRTLRGRPEAAGVLALNRAGALSFRDADHGGGKNPRQGGALAWLETLLQAEGITDAQGEIWLQCYPRVLGYSFKPVSFWYCHRTDGSLRAIVAEVNNTFGERHAYLLDHPRYGQELQARKVFHVSPFCAVDGGSALNSAGAGPTACNRPACASTTTMPGAPCCSPAWPGGWSPSPPPAAAARCGATPC